jgi:hypothetical protein
MMPSSSLEDATMDLSAYVKVTVVNLAFLLTGIWAGSQLFRDGPKGLVHAQQNYEEISPVISAGSAAFGTLLAGQLAADEITSRGINLLGLHEATLNLIAKKLTIGNSELQAVIDSARVPRPLRLKTPAPAKPEPPKPESKSSASQDKKQ